jgi:aminopeptidase N
MLMRQNAANPDDAFLKMIREFVENYKGKNASTWDFKRLAEKYMTSALDLRGDAKLDWFFDEWVFAMGIPTYSLDYKVEPVRNAFIVSGTIKRTGVSDNFTMPVPLYGDDVFLGRVPVGDSEESFRFQVTKKPERVVIDPQETILTRP